HAQTVGDILVDRFRERIRFLENHPNPPAQTDQTDHGLVTVASLQSNAASRDSRSVDQIVHAIKTAQQRRFSATGGPDEGSDSSRRDFQVHIEKDLIRAVAKIEVIDVDHDRLARLGFGRLLQFQRRGRMCYFLIFHYYHDRRFLVLSRRKMEARAIAKTSSRRMQAAPYCIRSVYSCCGILELTT